MSYPVEPVDTGKLDWIFDGTLAGRGYTTHDLATLVRVLSRPCPHCKAQPGEWCRNTGTGRPIEDLDRQHVARRITGGPAHRTPPRARPGAEDASPRPGG
ncbi:hypothetical protein [Actinopolymorpha sp. B9G3]|uniref:zinc finger domain-containing protein n=1 Tax=Actinopolymorpha sp. B9G3 TaxID=3158970 RepID=UPI0032D99F7B